MAACFVITSSNSGIEGVSFTDAFRPRVAQLSDNELSNGWRENKIENSFINISRHCIHNTSFDAITNITLNEAKRIPCG